MVERKRVDDLVKSLKDHRFENQKARMMYCRKEFKMRRLIYVVEGDLRDFLLER